MLCLALFGFVKFFKGDFLFMTARYKASLMLLVMGLIFIGPITSYAVPAAGIIEEINQPDGSPFKAQLQGDEFSNWVQTPDGYTIARGKNGYWFYVSGYDADNNPILTDVPAHQSPPADLPSRIIPSLILDESGNNPATENASYDPATGVLHLPAVEIRNADSSIEVLEVDFTLMTNNSENVFELTRQQKSVYSAGQKGNAVYDVITQVVSVPVVEVRVEKETLFYTGEMQLLPSSSSQFVVTQVKQLDQVDNRQKRGVRSLREGRTNGEFPVLFVLAEFNDQSHTYSAEELRPLMDKVKDYYSKASYGKVKLVPAKESYGTEDDGFVGWLKLNRNHPNIISLKSPAGAISRVLAHDVVEATNPFIDFSTYDTNKDGDVDGDELAIVIIVAGYEAALTPLPAGAKSLWAHKGTLGKKIENVYISSYIEAGEIHSNHPLTLGAVSHEQGHLIFDLPDLYDIDGGSTGVGYFCLMSGGSWGMKNGDSYFGETPILLSAWVRHHLGWINSQTPNCGISIMAAGSNGATDINTAFKVDSGNSKEYFLVENRQLLGYDRGFERWMGRNFGGLAIWHIDENQRKSNNTDNADEKHRLVDLEEADAMELGRGDVTDLWYADKFTKFGSKTTPNSLRYDGNQSGVEITDISKSGEVMTADFGSCVYGVNDEGLNDSQFFTINSTTLAVTPLGPVHEKRNLEALDMNSKGELYTVSSVSDSGGDDTIDPGYLYRVNKGTGEIEKIASIGYEDVDSISFDSNDQLWGWSKSAGAMQIDTATGSTQLYESPNLENVEDMSWNGSLFYVVNGTSLSSYDGSSSQTVCSLPGDKPEGVEFISESEMWLGVHGQSSIYVMDVTNGCAIVEKIDTPFSDIEGMAQKSK